MKNILILLGLLIAMPGFAAAPEVDPKSLALIADFNEGIQNRVGGYHNKFQSAPSSASVYTVTDVFRGEAGRCMKIKANQMPGGFCGAWIQLFDLKAEQKKYFDARNYAYLSFWVKGEKGGEDFLVRMADETFIAKEDSAPLGSVKSFLPGGITKEWQEVLVPLSKITNLDRMNMGGITFDFTIPGEQTVYIDDVSFKTSPKIATPLTKKSDLPAQAGVAAAMPRAMWAWETEPILLDLDYRKKLLNLCKKENIGMLWVQLDYSFDPDVQVYVQNQPPPPVKCILKHPDKLRDFLREAHQAGLKVHGLDGFPEFAQKEYHQVPLAIVDAVLEFNKNSKPDERYDGIHFDNEPYLIIGWYDWDRRKQILKEFLDLSVEIQKRVHTQPGMVFGIDIPFWWQEKDEKTGKINGLVAYNGVEKPASHHCIDLLDNIGVMDYRDTADGADGIIAHGRDLMEYADKTKKGKVYLGIETFTYQPTLVWFAVGLPRKTFEAALKDKAKDFAHRSRINGFRTQILDDGNNLHVGIELKPNPTPEQEKEALKAVTEIAKRLGASSYPELKDKLEQIRADAEFGIAANVEWAKDVRPRNIKDAQSGTEYAGFVATSIMLPKITFADKGYDEIQYQIKAAEDFFCQYKSFDGIAIHYYDPYLKKVEEGK